LEQINEAYTAERLTRMVGWVEAADDTEKLDFVIKLLERESKQRFEAQLALRLANGTISNLQCDLDSANQIVSAAKNLYELIKGPEL
jgi:hypothetical protein